MFHCRAFRILLAFLLSPAASALGQGATMQQDIFRYIAIAPCGRLELGDSLDPGNRATRLNDSTFSLVPACFGGSVQILVFVTPTYRIYAFQFLYDTPETYPSLVASYRKSLGPPTATGGMNDGPGFTWWDDGKTRFEIAQHRSGARRGLTSRLTDLRFATPFARPRRNCAFIAPG
jgi:hypothetical protein